MFLGVTGAVLKARAVEGTCGVKGLSVPKLGLKQNAFDPESVFPLEKCMNTK